MGTLIFDNYRVLRSFEERKFNASILSVKAYIGDI